MFVLLGIKELYSLLVIGYKLYIWIKPLDISKHNKNYRLLVFCGYIVLLLVKHSVLCSIQFFYDVVV